MRAAILAAVATLALAAPAAASEADVEVIDAVIQAAIDERVDTFDLDPIYAVVADADTLPRCREYADLALVAMASVNLAEAYPESQMVQTVYGYAMEAVPVARNNCLLAI
jgi:hypothetical protein